MRNDFLTIPEAPDYEINSQLMVRNKKTGNFLTPYRGEARLYINKKKVCRSIKKLRKKAVIAVKDAKRKTDDWWLPVPSLNNLYELNLNGDLRNIKSKNSLTRVVKKNCTGYRVKIDGVKKHFNLKDLLWEVHGIIPKVPIKQTVPVTVYKNSRCLNFDSLIDTARFLLKFGDKSLDALKMELHRRSPTIYGWNIIYHETDNLHELHKK